MLKLRNIAKLQNVGSNFGTKSNIKKQINMKKIILAALILIFIGCNNDDENQVNNDYSYFLNLTQPQFRAKFNNTNLFWEFNVGTYQMSSAYLFPNGESEDPNRILRFVLNQENGNNQFVITTPIYDTSSETEYNNVFGLGLKKIGDSNENYHISIINNNTTHQICNSNANYKIEVLKTEEIIFENPNPNILKVWFKIDNIELNNCNSNSDYKLNDGLLIAHFIGYKSE